MTKEKIIKLYIADLNNLVADSDAKRNRIMNLEYELEALKEWQTLPLVDVSGLFEFSKFLNGNFEYFCNNIEVGDVYKCKRGRGLYSEKEVYDEYLRSK